MGGGQLELLASFPDRPPVRLKTLATVLAHEEAAAGTRHVDLAPSPRKP